jgi:hypothetical protein
MSHFYGTLKGNRGEATRCGTKGSGVGVTAASWNGAVSVMVYFDEVSGEDRFSVVQHPWHGRGVSETIATGTLGKPIRQRKP